LCYPIAPSQSVVEYFQENDQAIERWVDEIEKLNPDIVGITLWFSTGPVARMLASALKRRLPRTIVLGGGPDFLEGNKGDYLECFDYCIENEGERAICEFVEEYEEKGTITLARGVWHKEGKEIHSTGPNERIEDLDSLPIPDFSDFTLSSYSEGIPVMFSRGCSANCTFCTNKKFFKRQVSRSALRMYEEICTHSERTGLRKFIFADDSLLSPVNLEEFIAFCKMVKKGKLDIRWRIYAQRIIPALRKKHIKKMRRAGLESVGFGLESFSERVRADMGKTESDSVTQRVLFDCVDQGIRVNIIMIYGYPIETDEDFEKTLKWIARKGSRFSHINFNCFDVNSIYLKRRPGVVFLEENRRNRYQWRSKYVDLPKRRERFLRLAEILEGLNVDYMISNPFMTKFYREWNGSSKQEFEEEWNMRSCAAEDSWNSQ